MENINRLSRCCFTGHRPEKLHLPENEVRDLLRTEIRRAIEDGFTVFISGMARGTDMWAAEIVLEERRANESLKLICASPYEGFEKRWSADERVRYNTIMQEADFVRFVCPGYSRGCFQIRNRYMVDRSARVIAVFNGEAGGTRNTIQYAERSGVQVMNILY